MREEGSEDKSELKLTQKENSDRTKFLLKRKSEHFFHWVYGEDLGNMS